MEELKKVVVCTTDTRKFVDSLLYLGSIGGRLTDKCVAMKGVLIRAEVEVPVEVPVEETPVLKVSVQPTREEAKEEPVKAPKVRKKKEEEVSSQEGISTKE